MNRSLDADKTPDSKATRSRTQRALAAGLASAAGASVLISAPQPASADPHDDIKGDGVLDGWECVGGALAPVTGYQHGRSIYAGNKVVGSVYVEYSANGCVRARATLFDEFKPDGNGCWLHAHLYKPAAGADLATARRSCDEPHVLSPWVQMHSGVTFMGVGLKYYPNEQTETAGGHTPSVTWS